MNCPGCQRTISKDIKKNIIFSCCCGKLLQMLKINNVKRLVDVTPKNKEVT